MTIISTTLFQETNYDCLSPLDGHNDELRFNPPFICCENHIEDDILYVDNEHYWDKECNPKEWRYSEGLILVGIWKIKYKNNGN